MIGVVIISASSPCKRGHPLEDDYQGHINLQNRHNAYQVDELKANDFYDLTVDLQPTFTIC